LVIFPYYTTKMPEREGAMEFCRNQPLLAISEGMQYNENTGITYEKYTYIKEQEKGSKLCSVHRNSAATCPDCGKNGI